MVADSLAILVSHIAELAGVVGEPIIIALLSSKFLGSFCYCKFFIGCPVFATYWVGTWPI